MNRCLNREHILLPVDTPAARVDGDLVQFLLSLRESSVAHPTDVYLAALGLSGDDSIEVSTST